MGPTTYNWLFGNRNTLTFPAGGDPVLGPDHQFNVPEGSACISDMQGGLLFYTDGRRLWDRNHALVTIPAHGLGFTGLGGGPGSCHNAVIVPPVGNSIRHHLITVPDWSKPWNQPHYTPIDADPVTGNVTVAAPTTPLPLPLLCSEHIAVVSHANCEHYWVVLFGAFLHSPPYQGMTSYLINGDGFPVLANGVQPFEASWTVPGEGKRAKFSPDGKLLAATGFDAYDRSVHVYDFDNATGLISHRRTIITFTTPYNGGTNVGSYGVEFSPDSQQLYFTTETNRQLWRMPVPAPKTSVYDRLFLNSATNIWPQGSGHGPGRLGALELAPNGHIYGMKRGENTLFEITDPDNPGSPGLNVNAQIETSPGTFNDLTLNRPCRDGLPTFTRITNSCRIKTMTGDLFPWRSATTLNANDTNAANEPLQAVFGTYNNPGTDLTSHQVMTPMPYHALLVDLFFFKPANQPAFSGTIDITIDIIDANGAVLRTVSAGTIDFKNAPDMTWIPVPLTASILDLTVNSGEIVAGCLTFSSDPGSANFPYVLNGRGKYI